MKCRTHLNQQKVRGQGQTHDKKMFLGANTDLRGTVLFGIPIGSDEFVTHKLREIKDKIVRDAWRTRDVLATSRQALWTALRLSVQQRFQYWMQLVPPSLCTPVAAELDEELWRLLEAVTGFLIPRGEEDGGLSLRVPYPRWIAIPTRSGW